MFNHGVIGQHCEFIASFPLSHYLEKELIFFSLLFVQSKTEDRIDPTEGGDSIVASKDEDRINALPSEILLHILERLDLRTAI